MISLRVIRFSGAAMLAASFQVLADAGEDTLKRFAEGVQTFQAHFEQVQTDDHGKVTSRSSGEFWLQRPTVEGKMGKFRWAYQKPYEQVTVCDGTKLWHYDPDLNQVTVRAAKDALAGSPAELLSQRGALSNSFSVQDAGRDGESSKLRLLPKSSGGDFKSIEMTLDKTGAPVRMRFADQIGGTSDIFFANTSTNSKLSPERFQFMPPKGAEIVNGDGPVTKALE